MRYDFQNFFDLNIITPAIRDTISDTATTIQNANMLPCPGTPVFMPNMLAMSDGIEIISVITVRVFITLFWLLEITEAYASIVPLKMSR